jgi:hypothetical protein
VKFVGVREGDAVAVVARSIESTLDRALGETGPDEGPVASTEDETAAADGETEDS